MNTSCTDCIHIDVDRINEQTIYWCIMTEDIIYEPAKNGCQYFEKANQLD